MEAIRQIQEMNLATISTMSTCSSANTTRPGTPSTLHSEYTYVPKSRLKELEFIESNMDSIIKACVEMRIANIPLIPD